MTITITLPPALAYASLLAAGITAVTIILIGWWSKHPLDLFDISIGPELRRGFWPTLLTYVPISAVAGGAISKVLPDSLWWLASVASPVVLWVVLATFMYLKEEWQRQRRGW